MILEDLPSEVAERLARLPDSQRKAFLLKAIERELLLADFLAKRSQPKPEAASLLNAARKKAEELKSQDREALFDRMEELLDKIPA